MVLGAMAVLGAALGLGVVHLAWRLFWEGARAHTTAPRADPPADPTGSAAPGAEEIVIVPEGAFTWQTESSKTTEGPGAQPGPEPPSTSPAPR